MTAKPGPDDPLAAAKQEPWGPSQGAVQVGHDPCSNVTLPLRETERWGLSRDRTCWGRGGRGDPPPEGVSREVKVIPEGSHSNFSSNSEQGRRSDGPTVGDNLGDESQGHQNRVQGIRDRDWSNADQKPRRVERELQGAEQESQEQGQAL